MRGLLQTPGVDVQQIVSHFNNFSYEYKSHITKIVPLFRRAIETV